MDLEDLRTFVAVLTAGSFSQASRMLQVSQPTVSRRIQAIEREFGAELIERQGGTLLPTRPGLELMAFAERTLREYERLRQGQGADSVEGTLAIASSSTPGESFLPGLVARFGALYPRVTASLHVMDSSGVARCVAQRRCDVGVLGTRPQGDGMSSLRLGEDEIVLATPRSHRFAKEEQIPLEALGGEVFVERHEGSATRATVAGILERAGARPLDYRAAVFVSSVQAQLSAVAKGQGIGFVSRVALRYFAGDVAVVRIAGMRLRREFYLYFDPQRSETAHVAFVGFMRRFSRAALGG